MKAHSLSAAFTTNKVEESRGFYVNYFDARVIFDCSWYVNLAFGNKTSTGLVASVPLEDHPWGDRGIGIQDPNGITLYIYSEREPGEAFRSYFK